MFVRQELIPPLKYAEIPLELLKKRRKITNVLPPKTQDYLKNPPSFPQQAPLCEKRDKISDNPSGSTGLIDTYA